jgi:hypothetical protein
VTPTQVKDTIAKAAGGFDTCKLRQANVDHPCTAFVGSFTGQALWGGMVAFGDRRVFVAADGLAIEPNVETQFVDANGNVLRMVSKPAPLSPAATPLLWELHCRA